VGGVGRDSAHSSFESVAVSVPASAGPSSPWLVAVLASSSHSEAGPIEVCPAAVPAPSAG
jgi:hypothetical protein